ncbi:MAG: hypothetical protein LC648_08140 [Novosphingobium sp.]|nr:hypothetical protein [Novosphingobium sp.]
MGINSMVFAMRPGLRAPAVFLAVAALAASPALAHAQTAPSRPMISSQPVPSELELAKLVWSTMAMVDHANRSGNYSVLRDTSATGFQVQNDPARLAEIFAPIRALRVDLGNALVVEPRYTEAPRLLQADVFQVKGYFPLRPTAIFFDLYFQWEQGRWKLFGISVQPGTMAPIAQPAAPAQQPAAAQPGRRRN